MKLLAALVAVIASCAGCAPRPPQVPPACHVGCPHVAQSGEFDCCKDSSGDTWSACAWRVRQRAASRATPAP